MNNLCINVYSEIVIHLNDFGDVVSFRNTYKDSIRAFKSKELWRTLVIKKYGYVDPPLGNLDEYNCEGLYKGCLIIKNKKIWYNDKFNVASNERSDISEYIKFIFNEGIVIPENYGDYLHVIIYMGNIDLFMIIYNEYVRSSKLHELRVKLLDGLSDSFKSNDVKFVTEFFGLVTSNQIFGSVANEDFSISRIIVESISGPVSSEMWGVIISSLQYANNIKSLNEAMIYNSLNYGNKDLLCHVLKTDTCSHEVISKYLLEYVNLYGDIPSDDIMSVFKHSLSSDIYTKLIGDCEEYVEDDSFNDDGIRVDVKDIPLEIIQSGDYII